MKKRVFESILSLSLCITAFHAYAYFSESYLFLDNSSLRGINTVVVDVEPPINSLRSELENQGVSTAELQKRITERLQAAGINVISNEAAMSDPQAALLKLRIHLTVGYGAVYSWGLNLSLNQGMPLAREGSFYPVQTWSTGKFGGTQQSNLHIINDYSMELVEIFIEDHHGQK